MAAGSGVKAADSEAQQAALDVREAEAELAGGGKVGFEALHKLRDKFRHADLAAQGARARAERDRAQARLDGLAQVGAEVDTVAATDPGAQLREALAAVAEACAQVRALAGAHDATVEALVAAATDLQAEVKAPAGPRATSAHVAVEGGSVLHKATKLVPVREQAEQALQLAVNGDVDKAAEVVRPVVEAPLPVRPDHLLRGRNGMLHPIAGPLNQGMQAHVRSGELVALGDVDIDRFMAGELS